MDGQRVDRGPYAGDVPGVVAAVKFTEDTPWMLEQAVAAADPDIEQRPAGMPKLRVGQPTVSVVLAPVDVAAAELLHRATAELLRVARVTAGQPAAPRGGLSAVRP